MTKRVLHAIAEIIFISVGFSLLNIIYCLISGNTYNLTWQGELGFLAAMSVIYFIGFLFKKGIRFLGGLWKKQLM